MRCSVAGEKDANLMPLLPTRILPNRLGTTDSSRRSRLVQTIQDSKQQLEPNKRFCPGISDVHEIEGCHKVEVINIYCSKFILFLTRFVECTVSYSMQRLAIQVDG